MGADFIKIVEYPEYYSKIC